MITLLLHLLRLLPFLVGGHHQLAVENLALRHQLALYKRTMPRPKLRTLDRLLWIGLARIWTGWRQALVIVSPDTVLRWQRRRFREYWTHLSRRPTGGRPPVEAEITALVRRMAAANPLWGAPRIHGELQKLGIDIAERTVSFAKTSAAWQVIDLSAPSGHNRGRANTARRRPSGRRRTPGCRDRAGAAGGWFNDYNTQAPPWALGMRSPVEYRAGATLGSSR